MEERWPAPSSEVHAQPRQPFQDEAEDFFSNLHSPASDSTRDGVAMATLQEHEGSLISKISGVTRSGLDETHVSAGITPIPASLGSSDNETAQIYDSTETPSQSGLTHVFVGSSFADERRLPASARDAPSSETELNSASLPNPGDLPEQPTQSPTPNPGVGMEDLQVHSDMDDISFLASEKDEAGMQNADFLERNTHEENATPHYHADYTSASWDSRDITDDQISAPEPSSMSQDITDPRSDAQGDMEEITNQLEQVHIYLPSNSDDAGFEGRDHADDVSMANSSKNDGYGVLDMETAMTETSIGEPPDTPTENTLITAQPLTSHSTGLDADTLRSAPDSEETGTNVGSVTDFITNVIGSNADNPMSETQQDMDWALETNIETNIIEDGDTVFDEWSTQMDRHTNLEDENWAAQMSGTKQASATQAVTEYHEQTGNYGHDGTGDEVQDSDVQNNMQQEPNSTQKVNDNVGLLTDELGLVTETHKDQFHGSVLLPASHDERTDKSMEFSFYGSDEINASNGSAGIFESTDHPTTTVESTEAEYFSTQPQAEMLLSKDLDWTTNNEVNDELGDSWAQALGPADQGLDESWGAAFGDGLDDDGFLEDSPMESFITQDNATTQHHVDPIPPMPQTPTTTFAASAYTASPPILAQKTTPQQQSSTPMEFFADLPTTQPVRSRKPKPQLVAYPSQAPIPAPPTRPEPPPRTSSVPVPQSQYMPFQPPERLDLFPQQETPRPTMPTPPSTLPRSYTSAQIPPVSMPKTYAPAQPSAPPSIPRYSPATIQPASVTTTSKKPPSPMASQYSATPVQLVPPHSQAGAATRPRSKSPYAPAPTAEALQSTSHVKQMPPMGSAGMPLPLPLPHEARLPAFPPSNPRYSPAQANPQPSVAVQSKQPAANFGPRDYSRNASPFTGQPPPPNPFAPRTSSPLAQPEQRPLYDRSYTTPVGRPEPPPDSSHMRHHSLGDIMEDSMTISNPSEPSTSYAPQAIGAAPYHASDTISSLQERPNEYSPPRRVPPPRVTAPKLIDRSMSYAPNISAEYQPGALVSTIPPRPRTSSPTLLRTDAMKPLSSGTTSFGQPSHQGPIPPGPQQQLHQQHYQHPSGQENMEFVLPTDHTAMDPLQRWKGSPIFRWGCGGIVSTSFPTHIPRYGGGKAAPKLKCVGGEVKIRKLKDLYPDQETLLSFPGPLKTKNKKKEVVSWVSARIASLQQEISMNRPMHADDTTLSLRSEEKVLLWQLIRLMVENDGILTSNAAADSAVRKAILPEANTIAALRRGSEAIPIVNSSMSGTTESNLTAVSEIRQHLLQGEREKAIWHAVDNKLWGHAMLMSSTVDKAIWKQVIQEFVRKEVRANTSSDAASLGALYEVFAGNWDESVDQLVPLSARTGFHMVSTTQVGQNLNSLQNMNKWRETLGLILANRSSGDEQGLLALGKLLLSYGRVEAAHICFIFARSTARFGGMDDSQTTFSLLGADHSADGGDAGRDIDAILLSEIYEFALSLSAPSSASYYIPHLQVYKLNHAYALCEIGSRGEAMQYCQEIGAALKSTTRGSPYYHVTFAAQLDDLAKRLSQTPKDSGSGWISKPSIQQVSGSMGKWFNNFIVGDEADNASTGSGAHSDGDIGPFGKMAGGTPTISRQSSMVDLHSFGMSAADAGGSRYAPNPYSSFSAQDTSRGIQSSYSPSVYGSSPEQVPKIQDRRITSANPSGTFGSPPSVPPFTRQPSNLSRYKSNEAPTAEIPNLVRPQLSAPYEPYAPSMPAAAPTSYPINRPYSTGSTSEPQRASPYAPLGARGSEPVSRPDSGNDIFMANGFISRPQSQNRPQTFGRLTAVDESPDLGYKSLHSEDAPSPDLQNQGYGYGQPSSGYVPIPSSYEPPGNNDESQQGEGGPPLVTSHTAPSGYGFQGGVDQNLNTGYGTPLTGYEPPSTNSEAPNEESKLQNGGYGPSQGGYDPTADYAPMTSGYEPPTSGYEPLPYTPYDPQSSTTEEADPPAKKKSFMDDDEDDELAKQAAALQKQQKAQRDKEADENFRRAAEADAARDVKAEKKSGWFGGLFGGGGKKDANAPVVHKAKLGDENSFYFDTETNKWVNRKAGATPASVGAVASSSTPPPPRGTAPPPGRAVSGGTVAAGGGPPPPSIAASGGGPPQMMRPSAPATPDLHHLASASNSRTGSPATMPPQGGALAGALSNAGVGGSIGGGGSGPPSAPPSRPGTGLGMVSDIDELLVAGVRKGGAAGTAKKGKKGARYVDVMAK